MVLSFSDNSNRYFGDYHRILVDVTIRCRFPAPAPDEDPLWAEARAAFGQELVVNRTLERMAVASAEVEPVRARLVEEFLASAASYLAHDDYPRRLVGGELQRRRRPRRAYP